MISIFKTGKKIYELFVTEFVCNKFGLAEFFAENFIEEKKFFCALDAGCGVGPISIYLAEEFQAKVTAVDINSQAIECCRKNINKYNLQKNIFAIEGNYAEVYKNFLKKFHLIVSNPPINTDVDKKILNKNFPSDFEKYQFLTNSWCDGQGLDLTDYILISGKKLLTYDGRIFFVCCDIDCDPENYIEKKSEMYGYETELICREKISATKLGISSKNFVTSYIFVCKLKF